VPFDPFTPSRDLDKPSGVADRDRRIPVAVPYPNA
jgi:hypothetical protein